MKKFILAAVAASVLASAFAVQAAERPARFDAQKVFQEVERYSGA